MGLNKTNFSIRFRPSEGLDPGSIDEETPGLGVALVTILNGAKQYSFSKGIGGLKSTLTIHFSRSETPEPPPRDKAWVTIPDYDSGAVVFPVIKESSTSFTIETLVERVYFFPDPDPLVLMSRGQVIYPIIILVSVVWEEDSLGDVTITSEKVLTTSLYGEGWAYVTYQASSLDM